MGTVFSIDVRDPGVPIDALDEAMAWLHWVDATFSTYRADSVVSRLARGELAVAECDGRVREVLENCRLLTDETDGFFSAYAAGTLDPSGFVKGWAIEQVDELLRAAGSTNHCVNGGGDVQCAGRPEPGRDWAVGISDPLRPGQVLATVHGSALAVATSGVAERGAHVLDPHTRRAPEGLASVTVIGTRLGLVDAYATAAFARGCAAPSWLVGLSGLGALVVFADGRQWSREPQVVGVGGSVS